VDDDRIIAIEVQDADLEQRSVGSKISRVADRYVDPGPGENQLRTRIGLQRLFTPSRQRRRHTESSRTLAAVPPPRQDAPGDRALSRESGRVRQGVAFATADGRLSGRITWPDAIVPVPGVVLIGGSGPADRQQRRPVRRSA
jgi:hypothetical protein